MKRLQKHHRWAIKAGCVCAAVATAVAIPLTKQNLAPRLPNAPSSTVCHIQIKLPDPTCTPGAINTNVTQANIQSTICVQGYTKTIRPPASYTAPLKIQSITQYGYADTNPKSYEYDHLVALEDGGNPTDTHNLWSEPIADAHIKDKVENAVHRDICNGKLTLAEGQHILMSDWTQYVGK